MAKRSHRTPNLVVTMWQRIKENVWAAVVVFSLVASNFIGYLGYKEVNSDVRDQARKESVANCRSINDGKLDDRHFLDDLVGLISESPPRPEVQEVIDNQVRRTQLLDCNEDGEVNEKDLENGSRP